MLTPLNNNMTEYNPTPSKIWDFEDFYKRKMLEAIVEPFGVLPKIHSYSMLDINNFNIKHFSLIFDNNEVYNNGRPHTETFDENLLNRSLYLFSAQHIDSDATDYVVLFSDKIELDDLYYQLYNSVKKEIATDINYSGCIILYMLLESHGRSIIMIGDSLSANYDPEDILNQYYNNPDIHIITGQHYELCNNLEELVKEKSIKIW